MMVSSVSVRYEQICCDYLLLSCVFHLFVYQFTNFFRFIYYHKMPSIFYFNCFSLKRYEFVFCTVNSNSINWCSCIRPVYYSIQCPSYKFWLCIIYYLFYNSLFLAPNRKLIKGLGGFISLFGINLKIWVLPSDTKVYCTHEYTLANLAFALHVDASNQDLQKYTLWAEKQRAAQLITLPTDIDTQKRINPFLRTDDQNIQAFLSTSGNLINQDRVSCFAALRTLKDKF